MAPIPRSMEPEYTLLDEKSADYDAEELPSPRRRFRPRNNYKAGLITMAVLTILGALAYFDIISPSNFPQCHHRLKKPLTIEERVEKILSDTPLIDGHNDLPILIRMLYQNRIYSENFTFDSELPGHVDLPRLRKGRVGGTFWSVFVECPKNSTDLSDSNYYQAVHDTLQQIDLVHRLISAYPSSLALSTSPHTTRAIHKSGRIASLIGAEGLHQIGNSASTLRHYYALGVRYITLTHLCNNVYADGALSPHGPIWNGLNPQRGPALLHEMNRIGMIIDLSHVTAQVMRDVLDPANAKTQAPVIFSHSSVYALCAHDRNVPDDVLHLLKRNGGVIMINFYPAFLTCTPNTATTIETVIEHILYVAELIGWEHVGLGTDYDGIERVPEGLGDVSKFPVLVGELLRRGVSEVQAGMLVGGNLLRVWEGVEEVAKRMQKEGAPVLEDEFKVEMGMGMGMGVGV